MFKECIKLSSVKCITKLNSFYPLDYSNFDSDNNLSLLKDSQDNISHKLEKKNFEKDYFSKNNQTQSKILSTSNENFSNNNVTKGTNFGDSVISSLFSNVINMIGLFYGCENLI